MNKITKQNAFSKTSRRREREKNMRREAILRAAETLFAQNGYRKTRIEDISDLAEVSVGAVYGHFKNKEELLTAVLDDIGQYIRMLASKAFKKADSTLEGIERAGMAFFEEVCVPYPEKVLLLYDESIDFSSEILSARKTFMLKMTADVNHALMQAKDALGIDSSPDISTEISAEVMAVCTTAIFVWLGLYYRLWQKDPEEIIALGRETIGFILGGIKNLLPRNIMAES
jgi:AcrR family transcriptional regulator